MFTAEGAEIAEKDASVLLRSRDTAGEPAG